MKSRITQQEKKEIISRYFEASQEYVQAGEILLHQNKVNEKLYYVHSGRFQGFLPDEGIEDPVFEASAGNFIGVYSFFSSDRKSYTELRAKEDAFISPFQEGREEHYLSDPLLQKFLLNLVVSELKNRQHFAGRMARDRQRSLKKLIKVEKMAILGQMSTGLAHELNNAIGSLNSNVQRISQQFTQVFLPEKVHAIFNKAKSEGQRLSTAEARENRKNFERIKGLNKNQVKTLAGSTLTPSIIQQIAKNQKDIPIAMAALEMGSLLHDMKIAGDHATHVVQSVKTLGVANQNWSKEVDLNKTIKEALAILAGPLKNIETKLSLTERLPPMQGSPGELMQVWINLVKNAAESLHINQVENPTISINTDTVYDVLLVSISDNGVGIPVEIQKKIFSPNFTTKVGGLSFGLGLGLPIVERIVAEHEGTLHLDSQPGKTTFSLSFPIVTNFPAHYG